MWRFYHRHWLALRLAWAIIWLIVVVVGVWRLGWPSTWALVGIASTYGCYLVVTWDGWQNRRRKERLNP